MQIPFPFEAMLIFGSLSMMLLFGILVRAKLAFFQHFLIPSCLIGGIVGLILLNTGVFDLSVTDLETFAYHFFNISFISVGLTNSGNQANSSLNKKEFLRGPLWMALTQTTIFTLQALIGGFCAILLGLWGIKLFPTFGFFAPLGFEEGPGQALSFGRVWEGLGFEHAATIGLTFATIGYFLAFFLGVPLVNWGIRKGLSVHTPHNLSRDFLTGVLTGKTPARPAGTQTLHSANVDTLAFQAALVGLVYIVTYAFVKVLGSYLAPDVASMLWGFFFFFGLIIALCLRWFMGRRGVDHLIDPGIQRRITGWSIDFLIVSTVMAIKLTVVWAFILPISVISLACAVFTTMAVLYLGKRLWSYNLERTVVIFGTVTGTVSCGLLLLRIVDPDFKTPAVIEVALMNVIMLIPLAGLLVLVNAPIWWDWTISSTLVAFGAIMLAAVTLMRVFDLVKPKKF
jgi:ESS family glutamate:Na+ symporter